jgi:choice-of-anchor B domain-containing protein
MDMYSFKPHADLGSVAGEGSSSWGWTSDDGREFVAIGQADGTAFAEISPAGELIYLGRLPQQSVFSIWREIRGYKNYMVIGSEAVGHNVQIFDMTKLLEPDPAAPKNFSTATDLTGLFTQLPIGRTHNVVINEELNYGVAVGAQPRNGSCAAGLIYFDLTDPANPTSSGCAGQDGYVHDAQCLIYRGPDEKYYGRDICYGYNEDTLTIYDVTNKTGYNTSAVISKTSYVGASYTHQGWVLDPMWQEYLVLDDELDEEEYAGPAADRYPVTYIFDIKNLEAPKQTGYYKSKAYSIDHNQYVYDGLSYQSNYGAGLRVLDVSSIPNDPTGAGIEEVAYFDIYPEDDGEPNGGVIDFVGTWSHYAAFKSGFIFVNTIERGGFVVKMKQFEKRGRGRHYRAPRRVG